VPVNRGVIEAVASGALLCICPNTKVDTPKTASILQCSVFFGWTNRNKTGEHRSAINFISLLGETRYETRPAPKEQEARKLDRAFDRALTRREHAKADCLGERLFAITQVQ
jgi:hypothetical protein